MRCLSCNCAMSRGRGKPPPGERKHRARGLCSRCYQRERVAGRIHAWSLLPVERTRHDPATCAVCEDVEWLASAGTPASEWPYRLDTTLASLAKHLYRYGKPELARRVERLYRAGLREVA